MIARNSADFLLVTFVVAVIALMILPLPTWLLDMLIAINITSAILLLLSTLYVRSPLEFSTFPTILLLTTLFRLSISISTTRLILTRGDAGHIVRQFGELVAGGSLVVGLVVFLIITIVQFMVVAKGAERVAEVAARFSLDAMPGKQLSIDSDLRSGLLGKDEARQKRHRIELESKIHGSLDGAMKFVKGDAIASIIIVLVNLIGGLAIGVFVHGQEVGQAVTTYSILSIGDGLVAQVPALFSAMAAGLLVTRTTDEDSERHLAPTIGRQLGGKPHVLFTASLLALAIGIVPGFPTLIFTVIAMLLMAGAAATHPVSRPFLVERLGLGNSSAPMVAITVAARPVITAPALAISLADDATNAAGAEVIAAAIDSAVAKLQDNSGVALPAATVTPFSASEEANASSSQAGWRLRVHGVALAEGPVADLGDPPGLAAMVAARLQRNINLFLGLQQVNDLLNKVGADYPDVVKEVVRAMPTLRIAEVMRHLASEAVPMGNYPELFEAIAVAGQYEQEPVRLVERVRIGIRRTLLSSIAEDGRLRVLMIGSALEEGVRDLVRTIDGEARIALDPASVEELTRLIDEQRTLCRAQALLTAQDIRRPLRLLLAETVPEIPVISFNELDPGRPFDIVGELSQAPNALVDNRATELAA
ncbi:MAG: FHIPEP family type III secretion protein [Sphingomonas sp.]